MTVANTACVAFAKTDAQSVEFRVLVAPGDAAAGPKDHGGVTPHQFRKRLVRPVRRERRHKLAVRHLRPIHAQ